MADFQKWGNSYVNMDHITDVYLKKLGDGTYHVVGRSVDLETEYLMSQESFDSEEEGDLWLEEKLDHCV